MSPLAIMLVGSGINLMLVALLAGDKWVHKVTGAAPLESRVAALESQIAKANERWSEKMSAMTVYMETRRLEGEALARDVASLRGEWRGRTDTPPDWRR